MKLQLDAKLNMLLHVRHGDFWVGWAREGDPNAEERET